MFLPDRIQPNEADCCTQMILSHSFFAKPVLSEGKSAAPVHPIPRLSDVSTGKFGLFLDTDPPATSQAPGLFSENLFLFPTPSSCLSCITDLRFVPPSLFPCDRLSVRVTLPQQLISIPNAHPEPLKADFPLLRDSRMCSHA